MQTINAATSLLLNASKNLPPAVITPEKVKASSPSPELDKIKVKAPKKLNGKKAKVVKASPAAKAKKPEASSKAGNQTIAFKKPYKEGETLAPQARTILALVAKKKEVTVHDLVASLTPEMLKTVQSPARIWTFYRKALIENGYVTVK